MSGYIYSKDFYVMYSVCDFNKRIFPSELINMIMEVSTEQSEDLGVGVDYLLENNKGWILIQSNLEIKRLPEFKEKITIFTQAKGFNKFFAYREFTVKDVNGAEIAKYYTTFMILDLKERTFVKIEKDDIDFYGVFDETNETFKMTKPKKLKEATYEKKYNIRYSDIDTNGHVNNAKYLDWSIDTLPIEFIKEHSLKKMNIKYEKEIRYGETIESICQLIESQTSYTSLHTIKVEDKIAAQIEYQWEK